MRTRVWTAVWIAVAVLALAAPLARAQDEPPPLTLRGEDTVILDSSVYAGRFLQYNLMKYVAKNPQAKHFKIDAKPRPDRSQPTVFPLFKRKDQLPKGKIVLAFGYTPYLTKADRARIEQKPGTVMIQRRGKVIVIVPQRAGYASDETHVNFLDSQDVTNLLEACGLQVTRSYSFPFMEAVGRVFRHNETIVVAQVPMA